MIGTTCCADSDRKVHVIKEGLDKKMGGHSYFLMNKISFYSMYLLREQSLFVYCSYKFSIHLGVNRREGRCEHARPPLRYLGRTVFSSHETCLGSISGLRSPPLAG